MAKSLLTAALTVTITVFLQPAAEMLYNKLDKRQTERSPSTPNNVWGGARSSVLESLRGLVWGSEITDQQAIKCIIGEAEDQGIEGMTAVAEAIRNRGHLKGVYGCKSPRIKKAAQEIWDMAQWAWDRSEFTNLAKGADHWHSTDEPPVWWERYGKRTTVIGKHKFYKEVYK